MEEDGRKARGSGREFTGIGLGEGGGGAEGDGGGGDGGEEE